MFTIWVRSFWNRQRQSMTTREFWNFKRITDQMRENSRYTLS